MAAYKMTAKELILTSGSSKGSQIKFLKDGYWYKIDECGPEGKAEELAYRVLSFSDLSKEEFVPYESCEIEYNQKTYMGCRSHSFYEPGEQLLSYEKICSLLFGENLSEIMIRLDGPTERIDFVVDMIKGFCGLDTREHIAKTLTSDMFLLNTDRHFNNFGIIVNEDQTLFRNAPIFDNGASFLSNFNVYPPSIKIDDIRGGKTLVTGKPFAADLEYQASVAGLSVRFDFESMEEYLDKEPDSRLKEILSFQIERYRDVLG